MNPKVIAYFIVMATAGLAGFLVFYARWIANPEFSSENNLHFEEIRYRGTFGDVYPLYAVVCYTEEPDMPIVVLMHAYSNVNDRYSLMHTAKRFAKRGFFVVVPDMRGRGTYAEANLARYNVERLSLHGVLKRALLKASDILASLHLFRKPSAGKRDSSGMEIHDIYDGVEFIKRTYEKYTDGGNVNIIGYSGGGGNVLAAIGRAPDYFNVAVSYFGISDYKLWYYSLDDEKIKTRITTDIGGQPDELPIQYEVRNSNSSAKNNLGTLIYLFVDAEDRLTPRRQSESYCGNSSNCRLFVSEKHDTLRYRHGNPSDIPDLVQSENVFLTKMRFRQNNGPDQKKRNFHVNGFIFYKQLTVVFGKGDNSIHHLKWEEKEDRVLLWPTASAGAKGGYIIKKMKDSRDIIVHSEDRFEIRERAFHY